MRKNIFLSILIMFLLFSAYANNVIAFDNKTYSNDLESIQREIYEHNAKWVADYNNIFTKERNNVEFYLGANSENITNENNESIWQTSTSPPSYDWRDIDGKNYITSIKNQASCGSCVGFASIAVLEAVVQIETDEIFDCDLSESHLFFCGGGSCGGGWYPDAAAEFIETVGVVDELCFPYSPLDLNCDQKEDNWNQRTVRAKRTGTTSENENIKNALIEFGPLLATFKVYEDFSSYTNGIYEHVWGSLVGGHAVAIVGYNDEGEYWICKNSWGSSWGENGFFKIKYRECEIDNRVYFFDDISGNIQPTKPEIIIPEQGADSLDVSFELNWNPSLDVDGTEVSYTIFLNEGLSVDINDQPYISEIKQNSYQIQDLKKDTAYSCQIIAEDENGAEHTGERFVFSTRKPIAPTISGPNDIKPNRLYSFTASTSDDEGKEYYWYFDWGNEETTGWLGPFQSGEEVTETNEWADKDNFEIRVKYKEDGIESEWGTLNVSTQRFSFFNFSLLELLQSKFNFPFLQLDTYK